MQTIKTSAVVVLMLTVLYGGYVSLTTPPEPLPEEIQDYLVIEESGESFDFPSESIAPGLQLTEPPESVMADAGGAFEPELPAGGFGEEFVEPPAVEIALADDAGADQGPTFGSSFADLPPTRVGGTPATSASFSQPADSAMADIDADAYGSTDSTFNMPNPNDTASQFDPNIGKPFDGPSIPASAGPSDLGLQNAIRSADEFYGRGQLKEALATLSVFYGNPDLSEEERTELLSRLDPLAREVVYSKRHLLEIPHKVMAKETLADVAAQYDVPWQLLAKINSVEDPVTVLPGTELKTVRGPFRAEVNLSRNELTLFLGDLYAGRFSVAFGSEPMPREGSFTVQDKQTAHVYFDAAGTSIPAGDPKNPYGNVWLDLGGQLCIHGSPNTVQPNKLGCISLSGDDSQDLFAILSQGSAVTIRR